MESAPTPSQNAFPQELQREGVYIHWEEMIFPRLTYTIYLLKYICFRLNSKVVWTLPFPHLQSLVLLLKPSFR